MSTDEAAQENQADSTQEGPQSVKGPRINKGLVIVNTGNGKGKTTAAMGTPAAVVGPGSSGDHAPVHQALHGQLRRAARRAEDGR